MSAVLGAIAASAGAGAGEAVKDTTKAALTGTRDRLVARVRKRLAKDPVGDAKLTVYSAEPTPENGQALHQHLADAKLDQDPDILTLARDLLDNAEPAALAPGSVAATVVNQVNKDGGIGFIGGQHVHHHGTRAEALQANWVLLRLKGHGYELRNIGTATAHDVAITANVHISWPTPAAQQIPPGSSVMFICEPSLADPPPVLTVSSAVAAGEDRQRWQRPLPR